MLEAEKEFNETGALTLAMYGSTRGASLQLPNARIESSLQIPYSGNGAITEITGCDGEGNLLYEEVRNFDADGRLRRVVATGFDSQRPQGRPLQDSYAKAHPRRGRVPRRLYEKRKRLTFEFAYAPDGSLERFTIGRLTPKPERQRPTPPGARDTVGVEAFCDYCIANGLTTCLYFSPDPESGDILIEGEIPESGHFGGAFSILKVLGIGSGAMTRVPLGRVQAAPAGASGSGTETSKAEAHERAAFGGEVEQTGPLKTITRVNEYEDRQILQDRFLYDAAGRVTEWRQVETRIYAGDPANRLQFPHMRRTYDYFD